MKQKRHKEEDLKRIRKQEILFNQREMNAIMHYCRRFKVHNRSKFMREAIITEVLKKFEANHPTLFEDQQLALF
jgi:hypothetical protein